MTPGLMRRIPLYARILAGVALGALLGVVFGERPIVFHLTNRHLGELGLLVVRLLKALAVPLIFFAIVDAFVRTHLSARRGLRMVAICLLNVSVAMLIGLTIMNTWRPGESWRGKFTELLGQVPAEGMPERASATLDPLKNADSYVPVSLVDPFAKNSVVSVVLLSLFVGAAVRRARQGTGEDDSAVAAVERFVAGGYEVLVVMLGWIVQAIPFAVFGVVAQVVGRAGLHAFAALGVFLGAILLGLAVHALVYYPLMAWLVGRKPPAV